MNYRQWKKNYKKQHGYNPPLEEDKRKQAKLVKKQLKEIPTYTDCIIEAANKLAPTLLNAMATLCKGLSSIFAGMSDGFSASAKYYDETAAGYKRGR